MILKTQNPRLGKSQSAPLMEVFSSIQGEGAYVGETQTFVRFARCPLRCLYCDTPGSWSVRPSYRVYRNGKAALHSNPATVERVLRHCRDSERPEGGPLTVSLTGGEPLLYPDFVFALSRELRREGRRVHLETAGVHPHSLEKVLSEIDHVSMDWKIPSTLEKGDFREQQKRFLAAALRAEHPDLAVKIVITPDVTEADFREAVEEIAAIDRSVPAIVQPATPKRKILRRVPPARVQSFARIARRSLARVRVLPQLHPALGVR